MKGRANTSGSLTIAVGWSPCANGETYEFFLIDADNGERLYRAGNHTGVFRSVKTGDSISIIAAKALGDLLR